MIVVVRVVAVVAVVVVVVVICVSSGQIGWRHGGSVRSVVPARCDWYIVISSWLSWRPHWQSVDNFPRHRVACRHSTGAKQWTSIRSYWSQRLWWASSSSSSSCSCCCSSYGVVDEVLSKLSAFWLKRIANSFLNKYDLDLRSEININTG